jgi:phosphate starvation-inducible PhoH-like protein
LNEGKYDKIVITRPNVAVDDKDIGFLPGDILAKMTPWMMPILDVFAEYYSQKEIVHMIEEKVIEIVPIAYIRGRTFKNSLIIVDEAQGTTTNSMLSILTRIGENSKMVVTGDIKQSDRGPTNGLADFLQRFESSDHIELIKFRQQDIERHPVIEEILKLYGEE